MFKKFQKWNSNRKLLKKENAKRINNLKDNELIKEGIEFGKIIGSKKLTNFNKNVFLIKNYENAFYKAYLDAISEINDIELQKKYENITIKILENLQIELNLNRINLLTKLGANKYSLKHLIENESITTKIKKIFTFNKFKSAKEKYLTDNIASLQLKEDINCIQFSTPKKSEDSSLNQNPQRSTPNKPQLEKIQKAVKLIIDNESDEELNRLEDTSLLMTPLFELEFEKIQRESKLIMDYNPDDELIRLEDNNKNISHLMD